MLLNQIVTANAQFVSERAAQGLLTPLSKYPQRNLAVLTCMDKTLLDFLEQAMGLRRGEEKIIKVAGNTATADFDAVIGSLLVAVYELGVQEIIVMGHDSCGMLHTTAAGLSQKMRDRGISEDVIAGVQPQLKEWADAIGDVEMSVRHTVECLRCNPYLPKDIAIHGAVIHPDNGQIRILVDGSTECRV